jgi:hypothetical protein
MEQRTRCNICLMLVVLVTLKNSTVFCIARFLGITNWTNKTVGPANEYKRFLTRLFGSVLFFAIPTNLLLAFS